MPTNDKEFLIRVRADIRRANEQLQGLTDKLNQTGKAGQQAGRQTRVLSGDLGSLVRAALGAAAALGAIQVARNVVRAVDTYAQLEGRLRLVTDNTAALTRAEEELFQIAQRTRNTYEGTVDLYTRLARSTKDLNVAETDLLQVTETINQAIIVSGASAQSAQAALFQLGQGFGSGALRGEELNSILEQTPRIAQAIADGLGVPIGKLRELGAAGELTAAKVFRALQSQREVLEREFAQMPRTVGQAMIQLQNDVQRAFSGTNVQPLIDAIDEFRATISDPEIVKSIATITSATLELVAAAAEAAKYFAQIGIGLSEVIGAQINPTDLELLDKLQARLRQLNELRNSPAAFGGTAGIDQQIAYLEQRIGELRERLKPIQVLATDSEVKAANDAAGRRNPSADTEPGFNLSGASEYADKLQEQLDAERKAREKIREAIDANVAALQLEANIYGLTRTQAELYRLDLAGATEEQLAAAAAALESIDAMEQQSAWQQQLIDELETLKEEEQAYAESQQQAAEALRDVLDPTRELNREIAAYKVLLDEARISQDEFNAAQARAQEEFDRTQDKANETGEVMDQFAIQAARNMQSAFADFLFDPFEDGLQGMVRGFIDAMRRILAEALAAAALKAVINALSGGTASTGGSYAGLYAAIQHEGGLAGSGPRRQVPALVFDGAPRLHAGGFAGFKANEVPAILERGEEVLRRDDPRHAANEGGQGRGVRIVNVVDPSIAGDYLNSSAGERVIMNVLRRNRGAVREVLS